MKVVALSLVVCVLAVNGWWDEDETAVISSSILSNFRKHFNDILANKPANPPDFDVYEDMIDKKAEEAKKAIDNTAGASAAEKQKAKDEIDTHKEQIEDKFDLWEDGREKAQVMKTKYAFTVGAFIHFAKNNWNKAGLWGKYQIAKAALARQKPGFFASATARENFELAKDVLEDEYDLAMKKLGF